MRAVFAILFGLALLALCTNARDVCGPTAGPCEHAGQCVQGACVCGDKWAGQLCETARHSRSVAFVLQAAVGPLLGLPPGAGMFFIGRLDLAIPQLLAGAPPFLAAWAAFLYFCAFRRLRAYFYPQLQEEDAERRQYAPLMPAAAAADPDRQNARSCYKCLASTAAACVLIVLAAGALALWAYCSIAILTGAMRDAAGHTLVDDM